MDKALFMYHLNKNSCSIKNVADALEISRQAVYDKINNRSDFKISEIVILKHLLGLNADEVDNIFFNDSVSFKDTESAEKKNVATDKTA